MAPDGDVSGWAIVAHYVTVGEAEVAASSLDAAGIDCNLVDENLVRTDWLLSQALGGVKLVVRSSDLEAAKQLMEAPLFEEPGGVSPPVPSSEVAAMTPFQCPLCASHEFIRIPRLRIFVLFAAAFFGVGVAVGEPLIALTAFLVVAAGVLLLPAMRCGACAHRWTPPPSPERSIEAPLPSASDSADDVCPRCGSIEVHRIDHRRLKAIPMLFNPAILLVLPIWLMSPKRRCDACGLQI